nr:hypothetical protein [Tanacetum cinerariifolium]
MGWSVISLRWCRLVKECDKAPIVIEKDNPKVKSAVVKEKSDDVTSKVSKGNELDVLKYKTIEKESNALDNPNKSDKGPVCESHEIQSESHEIQSESHEIQSESHGNAKAKANVVKASVAKDNHIGFKMNYMEGQELNEITSSEKYCDDEKLFKLHQKYVEVFKNPIEFGYYEHSDGIDHENDDGDDDDDGGNESHVISREMITPITSSMTTFGSETSGKKSSLFSSKTSGKTFGSATSARWLFGVSGERCSVSGERCGVSGESNRTESTKQLKELVNSSISKESSRIVSGIQNVNNSTRNEHNIKDNENNVSRNENNRSKNKSSKSGTSISISRNDTKADREDIKPTYDTDSLEHVDNDDYNVFAMEKEHIEQLEYVNNTYLVEQGCYNDNLALMLAPETDETIRLAQESKSKLSDLIKPFDYKILNILYETFVPERNKSAEQKYFSNNSKMSYTPRKLKKAQIQKEQDLNSKPSVIIPAKLPNTANGSKPKPKNSYQQPRNWPPSMSSRVSNKAVNIAEPPRNSKPFLSYKNLACPTCKKCIYNSNHEACILQYLFEVKSHATA